MDIHNKMTFTQLSEILLQQLSESQSAAQSDWFNAALEKIRNSNDGQETQLLCSAMASRKLGSEKMPTEINQTPLNYWHTDELARVIFLDTYSVAAGVNLYDVTWHAYKFGDENEKTAYIKGLSLIDKKGELLDIAIHTGRTNNVSLFSAMALYNPYPAQFYDDRAFEQLVLKTLFMDLNINHIVDLQTRLQKTLSEKCMDLVRERIAADRSPPVSIWLAIHTPHLDEKSLELYLSYLDNIEIEHRYYSLLALKTNGPEEQYQSQKNRRKTLEADTTILELMK